LTRRRIFGRELLPETADVAVEGDDAVVDRDANMSSVDAWLPTEFGEDVRL
jgi:hypothetical protein